MGTQNNEFLKGVVAKLLSIKKIIEQTTNCFQEEIEIIDEIITQLHEHIEL